MTALVIVGEAWEAAFATMTLRDVAAWLPESASILAPPELGRIAGPGPWRPSGRRPAGSAVWQRSRRTSASVSRTGPTR